MNCRLKTKQMRALIFFLTCLCFKSCTAIDTITTTQELKDPGEIVSNGGIFTLGFFSPDSVSTKRYVGIWYSKPSVRQYIWVANKNNPLNDSSGVFSISKDGNLRVEDGKKRILWSSNISAPAGQNVSAAQLQDTGNLELRNKDGVPIWQTFDHPVDCFVPNMNLPLVIGKQMKALQSWTNSTDPSDGQFTAGIDITGRPQIVVWNGERRHWRSGPWNGNTFIGVQISYSDVIQNQLSIAYDKGGAVIKYYPMRSVLTTYKLTIDGKMAQIWWDEGKKEWVVQWQDPTTTCDPYSICGTFGTCNSNRATICQCLKGFEPKNKKEWSKNNWTDGCVRKKRLKCESRNGGKEDGFLRLKMMKLPDHETPTTGTQDDCRSQCLNNCSCLAYAYDTYSGCMTWYSTLVDIQEFTIGGLDFYLRLANSELGTDNKWKVISAAIGGSLGVVGIAFLLCFLWRRRANRKVENKKTTEDHYKTGETKTQEKLEELPLFSFESLAAATNNFDDSNKLGKGGFGSVYRGILNNGQEIAVKRLARASRQGIEEFMNEVMVISKLQHRNLVRLLGCSVEGGEKMLVYEYMPKKSLDAFLFVPEMRKELDWIKRLNIIEGICRGLNYLHKGSRLKIIHRDLKASNILLDDELNPKISDFGMARIFGGDQDEADTRRIVGTYGYMSPEYAMQGLFSEKSDVFSFGVLLIEIISGKRKGIFSDNEQSLSLLGYAWSLWNAKDTSQLIDPVISEPQHESEASRCVHLGLLCVQEFAKDRPTMSTVISMLNGEISDLPQPNKPGFASIFIESTSSAQSKQDPSANFISVTDIQCR